MRRCVASVALVFVAACGSEFNAPFSSSPLPNNFSLGGSGSKMSAHTEPATVMPLSGPSTFTIPVLAHRVSWSTVPGQWSMASVLPLLRDNPAGGYFSNDPTIIAAINAQMIGKGIWPMVSWWGPNALGGDGFLDAYLSVPGPPLAILYEAVGRLKKDPGGRFDFNVAANADTFVADMVYLHQKYFAGPHANRFVRVDGRPVVFIWISHAFDGPFDRVMARVRVQVPVYIIGSDFTVPLKIRPGIQTIVPAMDAISSYGTYNPDTYGLEIGPQYIADYKTALARWSAWLQRHAPQVKILPPMGFNYDETLIPGRRGWVFHSTPEIARRLAQIVHDGIVNPCETRMLPMAYMTSYDECYEGTCIIPSEEYGSAYLDVVSEVFGQPVVITEADIAKCRQERNRNEGPAGDQ